MKPRTDGKRGGRSRRPLASSLLNTSEVLAVAIASRQRSVSVARSSSSRHESKSASTIIVAAEDGVIAAKQTKAGGSRWSNVVEVVHSYCVPQAPALVQSRRISPFGLPQPIVEKLMIRFPSTSNSPLQQHHSPNPLNYPLSTRNAIESLALFLIRPILTDIGEA
jgi:hypothetical protein